MESEKYNLGKAQEKTGQPKEKVESGALVADDEEQKVILKQIQHELSMIERDVHGGSRLSWDRKKLSEDRISYLHSILDKLAENKRKEVLINLYAEQRSSSLRAQSESILGDLKKEFPIDPEECRTAIRLAFSRSIDYIIKGYSKISILESYAIKGEANLSVEEDIFNDPKIIEDGQRLVRGLLSAKKTDKEEDRLYYIKSKIDRIFELYKIAPSFFEGDFLAEGEQLLNQVVDDGRFDKFIPDEEYNSYNNESQKAIEILNIIGCDSEEIGKLFKNSLITYLSSSRFLEGIIEKCAKNNEYADLLNDSEVISAASTGRKMALENLNLDAFSKISERFGFSKDWQVNPEDVALVRKGVLNKIDRLKGLKDILKLKEEFGDPVIINDSEIRIALEKQIFESPNLFKRFYVSWKEALDVFNAWNFSVDKLKEYAKNYEIGKLSLNNKESDSLGLNTPKKWIGLFPEVLELPELRNLVSSKILAFNYLNRGYGDLATNLKYSVDAVKKAIEMYHLSPELLIEWETKVAGIELSKVKDLEQIEKFKKLSEKYLEVSAVNNALSRASLDAISSGDFKYISFLSDNFGFDPKTISDIGLQKAGEIGMAVVLQQGNFQGAVQIQEICKLPPEFIARPEINQKITEILADQFLCRGEFEDLQENIDLFGVFPEAYPMMDENAASSEQLNGNLSKFIKYLGDEDLINKFPQTFERVRELIFAKLATDQDLADYFVENLDKYYQQSWVAENVAKAIQQYSVAQKFIYAVENDQTTWKNEVWVVDILAKAKVIVDEHKKQFPQGDDEQGDSYGYSHGNEGFKESDPFASHPWLFTGQQIRIASVVSELMAGKTNAQGLKELGINANEISPLLAEVNEKVNTAYQNFLEQIRSNTNIKDEDKQALLNPESSSVKMTSLLTNIRSFVARYFVQSIEGDVTRLSEIGNLSGDLDRILAEGFSRYIKIHEVDVPLYDKLYEEFDTLRETGRSPLEVYLGRDGIYAYIGRHSQDVARRRKLGLEGRKKSKEMGEVVEIHPQYTVYPRYFRDNLNQETKRQFLEQEGISPEADPLFYDTGYTGTIPEQIMKVMDFSQEDIEKRIRLLSAPHVHRRVKGIPENARSEIIEYIEHNAKTEETAEGLIIDEKTGKIRHIAKPTNPEEQFYFMMVKQAVARHYWLQEQLHHEPSGNVNLDSEHYTIRIRQEYAKLLPSGFMQNPKEFLTQHGEMLKGSKGEGEYPDEEVVLFKMTDGTEIVAKKIELRKAKEARKEFSILISAKKAGLPTAEPVGFLSGKEDTDGSYLLMKKIEGISGRNFDKYLRDTGKFTEEKIKSILQQIAQKNKEMAELFRTTLKIDKRWRIKDTIIELNEETGEVENVIPIDWERAQNFNPATPKEIDEIA